jgi:lipoprotein-anchoring transpeptidase ErfK/SrfK
LSYTGYAIVVDTTTMRLRLYLRGAEIMNAPAGIGAPSSPTPLGQFFIAYLAQAPNPGYGPFVIVTSAHSNAITDWEASGDAEIGIHGPLGEDAAIGTTGAHISHGCVRLHVSDLTKLRDLPLGTPVTITS